MKILTEAFWTTCIMEGCCLRDLNAEDKEKVAKLIKQVLFVFCFRIQPSSFKVVGLKQENETLRLDSSKVPSQIRTRSVLI